jgi:carbonic anhydrase/acetyltransferase-like protein (isoleucine patch superfamily)
MSLVHATAQVSELAVLDVAGADSTAEPRIRILAHARVDANVELRCGDGASSIIIGERCVVSDECIIEAEAGDVHFGADCVLGARCQVRGPARFGARCQVGAYAVIDAGCDLADGAIVRPRTNVPAGTVLREKNALIFTDAATGDLMVGRAT